VLDTTHAQGESDVELAAGECADDGPLVSGALRVD